MAELYFMYSLSFTLPRLLALKSWTNYFLARAKLILMTTINFPFN